MDTKLVWIGMGVGSFLGGYIPLLWGGSAFSLSGVFLSGVGGLIGVWLGYHMGR